MTDNKDNAALRERPVQPEVRLCPVCGQKPKLVWVGGNATKGTMQFKAICCTFEFSGAQDSLAYKAKQSAILNWNSCIVKM